MSRRIVIATLATSVALIATQAIADRECFEDSCRVLEAAEQPAPLPQAAPPAAVPIPEFVPPEAVANAAAVRDLTPEAVAPDMPAPEMSARASSVAADGHAQSPVPKEVQAKALSAKPLSDKPLSVKPLPVVSLPAPVADAKPAPVALPQVVAEPAARRVPPQASPRVEDMRVRREPVRVAVPPVAEVRKPAVVVAPVAAPAPVRAAHVPVAVEPYPARSPQPAPRSAPAYIAAAPSVAPGVAVVEVPGAVNTGDGLVTVYPNVRPDPSWKVCQIDQRDLGRRAYRCTAHSYQPYGEGGYRPYGTYRSYQSAAGYVFAPDAKIIAVDRGD